MKTSLLVARTLTAGRRDPRRIAGAALALTLALSTLPLRSLAADPVAVARASKPDTGVAMA